MLKNIGGFAFENMQHCAMLLRNLTKLKLIILN